MNAKTAFYYLWILQLFSNLIILGMCVANLILIFKGHHEGILLALIFAIIIWKGEKDDTGFKALIKDYKAFQKDQHAINKMFEFEQINKRYSLYRKKEIPEKIIRKQLKRRKLGHS